MEVGRLLKSVGNRTATYELKARVVHERQVGGKEFRSGGQRFGRKVGHGNS